MLLALDTATQVMSLALHDGRSLLAEITWQAGNRHTTQLAPAVEQILTNSAVAVTDLTGLAVAVGPGSYTGLRIGVSLAKGMAQTRNLPLVGMSTLDILAGGQPHVSGELHVVVQAGRRRIIVGRYHWRKGRWKPRNDAHLTTWDTLIAEFDGPVAITGELDENGHDALVAAIQQDVPVTIIPAVHRLRRAGFLAHAAVGLLEENPDDYDAAQVVPFYLMPDDQS